MKRFSLLRLIAILCLAAMLLTACTAEPGTPSVTTGAPDDGKATYTVTVVDYRGQALDTDVLVEVLKDGESMGLRKADAEGKTSFKLERGDYTFTIATKDELYYDTAECVLSADRTEATVAVYQAVTEKSTIYVQFGDAEKDHAAYEAPLIGEGATYVEIDRTDLAYYLFAPTRGGIYRFTCISDEEITLGYYGDSNVVLLNNAASVENGSFELEFKNGTYTGSTAFRIVIGLSSATAKNAVLAIERIGDPVPVVPWDNISATQLPDSFERTDYLNHTLVNFDVTDPELSVVYSEADGFYHLGTEDGPVIYLRVSSDNPFLPSFVELCETANLCKYFYEDGKVVKKESYNALFAAYAEICDGNGVCPLTPELKQAIQNIGDHMKWWNFTAQGNNIFTTTSDGNSTGVNASNLVLENAALFACCTVEEFVLGTSAAPVALTPANATTYYAIVKADEPLCFTKDGTTEGTLTIENAEGLTLHIGNQTYTADANGKLTLVLGAEVTALEITSSETRAFSFTFSL